MKEFYIVGFVLLFWSCSSQNIDCSEDPESIVIKNAQIKIRRGYEYQPGVDSLSQLQSEEEFTKNGNLSKFTIRHDAEGPVIRQKSYEYNEFGKCTKVIDSLSGNYSIKNYSSSCELQEVVGFEMKSNAIIERTEISGSPNKKIWRKYNRDDKLLETIEFDFDSMNNPLNDHLGREISYVYNQDGLVSTKTTIDSTRNEIWKESFIYENGMLKKSTFYINDVFKGGTYFTYEKWNK